MSHGTLLRFAPLALLIAGTAGGQQKLLVHVPATSNIFAAGQSVAFSGTLPPVVSFTAGSVQAILFGAVGKVTLGGGEPYSGPDGIPFPGGTDLTSFNGLSGIIDRDRGFFLTGVFLDDSVPSGSGPPVLNFTGAEDFLTLSPQLFQTFFIGNGFTGSTEQVFFVPSGATRLFLGVSDGCVLAGGPPGCYEDNLGTFVVAVSPHPFTKQPSGN